MAYTGNTPGNKASPLGSIFNVIPKASGLHISLKNASAVTFVCYEDGGALGLAFKESIAGASEQVLPVVTDVYSSDGVGSVWTHETQVLDDAFAKADTTPFDAIVVTIRADQLSPGFDCVELTLDDLTSSYVVAIVHGLTVQRGATSLVTPVA